MCRSLALLLLLALVFVAGCNGAYRLDTMESRKLNSPYDTGDYSRNSLPLALLTFGEGWHNNHHRFASAARMGFRPGEIDITWLGLRAMEGLGLIRDLVPVPPRALAGDDRRAA